MSMSPYRLYSLLPQSWNEIAIEDGDGVMVETHRGQMEMNVAISGQLAQGIMLVLHG